MPKMLYPKGMEHMTKYELKKLSRRELLEMLIEQSKEAEILRERLSLTEELLKEKSTLLEESAALKEIIIELEKNLTYIYRICPLFNLYDYNHTHHPHSSPIKILRTRNDGPEQTPHHSHQSRTGG